MAEAFLSQLLRVENSVQTNSNERCMICLTECGTLCNVTGTVEMEIRLPCNHKVGSRCIATWLDPTGAANNSCPVCRHAFFPAQPRPYLEHGIMGGHNGPEGPELRLPSPVLDGPETGDEDAGEESYESFVQGREAWYERSVEDRELVTSSTDEFFDLDLDALETMCETYCYRLDLTSESTAVNVSRRLARNIFVSNLFLDLYPSVTAAVSVFITSHLTGEPKTLNWVSVMSDVETDEILDLYLGFRLARVQHELIDEEVLAMIGRGDLATVVTHLPQVRVS